LTCGDAVEELRRIESESVDAVITDPPYPHIKRDYGTWTTEEWWALIVEGVIPEVRRILNPTGSAVFILQPNSEHVGQMRGWLWEFMAWVCREWNMVQDAYWCKLNGLPTGGAPQYGMLKQAVKLCVWAGVSDCVRNQEAVLQEPTEMTRYIGRLREREGDTHLLKGPSGRKTAQLRTANAWKKRGGVIPPNYLLMGNAGNGLSKRNPGAWGHGAGTPLKLADWWTRYICPPGGTVLDPFVGSGTMMLAAIQNGCNGIGIDKEQRYIDIAQRRVNEAMGEAQQLALAL
jgi:hypothetical protein